MIKGLSFSAFGLSTWVLKLIFVHFIIFYQEEGIWQKAINN